MSLTKVTQGLIGGVFAGKNLLINGAFNINQRVYVSGTSTGGANQYTLDRWRVVTAGQSLVFSGGQITAPAGGVEQVVEGGNILRTGTYTLSWTGTATATVGGSAVANGGQVSLTAGSDATVKFIGGTVSFAQLEYGSFATNFEMRPFAVELMLCQRYYEKSYDQSTTPGTGATNGAVYGARLNGGTALDAVFKVVKRTSTPTMAWFSPTTGDSGKARNYNAGADQVAANGLSVGESGASCAVGTASVSDLVGVQWTASAEF